MNQVSGVIVDCAFKVHSSLGPGLFEEVYKKCLKYELQERKLSVETEVPVPIVYKNLTFDQGYRLDLLVEGQVIVELKAIGQIAPVHHAQLYTYLRLSNKPLGLLLNFSSKYIPLAI